MHGVFYSFLEVAFQVQIASHEAAAIISTTSYSCSDYLLQLGLHSSKVDISTVKPVFV
jgi:hypothetical protein